MSRPVSMTRRAMPRGSRRRRALTLIELMIAMTASAVVFLAALQAFRQGRLVQATLDSRMTNAAGAYDVWRLLSSDVAGSFVLQVKSLPGRWIGLPDKMQFLVVRPAGRPVEVEYKFSKAAPPAATGQVVRLARVCSGSVAIGQWDRVVVARDVAAFELRYAAAGESDRLAWTSEYNSTSAPPRAVEIHLVRAPAQGAPDAGTEDFRWVIPIRADMPAAQTGDSP
jgi:prepilin-type N-terminal cleavage/methylation domain-containing protein